MKIESAEKKNTLSVKITGRIDMETAPELEKFLKENIGGKESVTFDLKKVEYMSSAGLRVFLWLKKQNDSDGYIVMKRVSDEVRAVFDLTGFTDMFVME
jgi:anti-sigma B factor antagonist